MKHKLFTKATVISVLVLFFLFAGIYYFAKLDAAEKSLETDLFAFVPDNATAILEANDITELVSELDHQHFKGTDQMLKISRLLSFLNANFEGLVNSTAHGLSPQMNKILVSFHEPGTDMDQIIYCRLADGDQKRINAFIQSNFATNYAPRLFEYKGETIRIYPLNSNNFLACYSRPGFFAMSYQKKLIEKVIDAYLYNKSILNDPLFSSFHNKKKNNDLARLYIKMDQVQMGEAKNDTIVRSRLNYWTFFDLKISGDDICLSGTSFDNDSCISFTNALKQQTPIEIYQGKYLPAGSYFIAQTAASNIQSIFNITAKIEYSKNTYTDDIKECDTTFLQFVKENIRGQITSCMFHSKDTVNKENAIMIVDLNDPERAEISLNNFLLKYRTLGISPYAGNKVLYAKNKRYVTYTLPANSLFAQLTGFTESGTQEYICFYRGQMIISPEIKSLSSYIQAIDNSEFIENDVSYKDYLSRFAPSSNFVMLADMKQVMLRPEYYTRLIPGFFFNYKAFFENFIFSAQYTCVENIIYPNITLTYKAISRPS